MPTALRGSGEAARGLSPLPSSSPGSGRAIGNPFDCPVHSETPGRVRDSNASGKAATLAGEGRAVRWGREREKEGRKGVKNRGKEERVQGGEGGGKPREDEQETRRGRRIQCTWRPGGQAARPPIGTEPDYD